MYLLKVDRSLSGRVSPFRYLRIDVYLPLPAAFRSLSRLSSALSAKASTLRSYSLHFNWYSVINWVFVLLCSQLFLVSVNLSIDSLGCLYLTFLIRKDMFQWDLPFSPTINRSREGGIRLMSLYNQPSIQASLMSVCLQTLAILIAFFCSVLSFQGAYFYICKTLSSYYLS